MYALIANGVVVNVIVADADFVKTYEHGAQQIVPCPIGVGIGWTWDEVNGFQAPPTPAPVETPPATS